MKWVNAKQKRGENRDSLFGFIIVVPRPVVLYIRFLFLFFFSRKEDFVSFDWRFDQLVQRATYPHSLAWPFCHSPSGTSWGGQICWRRRTRTDGCCKRPGEKTGLKATHRINNINIELFRVLRSRERSNQRRTTLKRHPVRSNYCPSIQRCLELVLTVRTVVPCSNHLPLSFLCIAALNWIPFSVLSRSTLIC